MAILIDLEFGWSKNAYEQGSLFYWRNEPLNQELFKNVCLIQGKENVEDFLKSELQNNKDYTAGAIETDTCIIAWVDHVRSKPLHYSVKDKELYLSSDAHVLKSQLDLLDVDDQADLEFAMAGYVTGSRTVFKELYTLQPGEFLIWDKVGKDLSLVRYYNYCPDLSQQNNSRENQSKLGNILDALTQKVISRANDKTIWVPLSAGLDSRILLCKLHEHGYKDIKTFTYGPKYNFEAIHAKRIADTLNLPWQMILVPDKQLRELFNSDVRKDFWKYADSLKSIPCMREFSAIHYLHSNGLAQPGDIFLNGQSGDYITGGHIPEKWCSEGDVSCRRFVEHIVNKHYDLWFDLKTEENLKHIKNSIFNLIPEMKDGDVNNIEASKNHEVWEYDGRQICYVVNGQRVYEFFGYEWEMPLWEKDLVDFCQGLSLEEKLNQNLYKQYLRDYNYKGLFPEKDAYIWRWPKPMLWVLFVAKLIGWFAGNKAKVNFYARMRNKGHYANQYAFFSNEMHKNTYDKCRSIISLYIPIWQKENNKRTHYPVIDLTKISS